MKIKLTGGDTHAMTEVDADEMNLVMQGWYQHCWSWGSSGSFKVYTMLVCTDELSLYV